MTNIEKYIEEAVRWIREHQERFWAITGTTLLSFLFIALLIHHHETETSEAWMQLGGVQSQLAQGKMEDARKSLSSWETRFQRSDAASYANFIKADLAYRTSDYVQAGQIYGEAQKLAQSFLDKYPDHYLAAPMYMTQARLAELSGNAAAAVTIYDRFTLLFPQTPWSTLAKNRSQTLSKK